MNFEHFDVKLSMIQDCLVSLEGDINECSVSGGDINNTLQEVYARVEVLRDELKKNIEESDFERNRPAGHTSFPHVNGNTEEYESFAYEDNIRFHNREDHVEIVLETFHTLSNTDTTEGRGKEITLGRFHNRHDAEVYGKGKYVMGTNCPVQARKETFVIWFGPHRESDEWMRDQLRDKALSKLTKDEKWALGFTSGDLSE